MENQQKCQLAVCGCKTQNGNPYCSDDCEQAASQAIPRDFCQCAHGSCNKPVYHVHADDAMNLSDSISSAPGWLTIEYSSYEDLRRQLLLIAQAINKQSEENFPFRAEVIPRRGASAESEMPTRKAQSA